MTYCAGKKAWWIESAMAIAQDNAAIFQKLRRYGGGIGGFFSWWRRSLVSWLPARLRSRLGMAEERLLLAYIDDRLEVRWLAPGEVTAVAQLPWPVESTDLDAVLNTRLAALPRWWILSADDTLRRRIWLPAAAAERLRDVVRFEIDRLTPFQSDDVCFDAHVAGRRDDGQIDVEMVVIPRVRLQAVFANMGKMATQLEGIDVVDASGRVAGVNLLPLELRRRRSDPSRLWNGILAAIVIAATVASAWSILNNRRNAADVLESHVNQEMQKAAVVAAQRQQLTDTIEGDAFLTGARSERPAVIQILSELTNRLPDTTYLESISIENKQLQITGQSSEASALVAKLEGSPLWRSPALTGALQPDARTRRDRFNLTAELGAAARAAAQQTAPPKGGS
ncbi:MAG: PilN domain-containing protein [Xanthomonadaceae bacterium]|jgi:general secretion pathway protein L|nr:PilN domain-containing protein [Xanthomonadaceae bacterium]